MRRLPCSLEAVALPAARVFDAQPTIPRVATPRIIRSMARIDGKVRLMLLHT